jgi:hypothetical protein
MTAASYLTCVTTAASLLVLSACSAQAGNSHPGVLETSAGVFAFTLTSCSVYRGDGVDDIEIDGPGTAPDGEKFFFELSSTGNELTIGLGVDGPFASPERRLKAGRYVSQEFTLVVSERQMSASGVVLVDENGALVDGNATLTIDCGA